MDKTAKKDKILTFGLIALVINSIGVIVLRIRKMIHLSMVGDEPTGFDWYMIVLFLVVIFLSILKLSYLRKERIANQPDPGT